MKNNRKKINPKLIVMNKGERIAVISLLNIIAILLAFSVFRPALHFTKEEQWAFHNLDSLIALREKESPPQPTIAVSPTPVESNDVKKNQAIFATKKTPSKPQNTTFTSDLASSSKKEIPILDLNTTDSVALVALPQIGEVMASRIQRYRDRLGGFVCYEQLYEVKGMDSTRYATVRPYLLLDTSNIRKLEVNRDEFKVLLRHPYLEYEQVKAIVNHRERKGLIRNWGQLKEIVGEVNPLLKQYLNY